MKETYKNSEEATIGDSCSIVDLSKVDTGTYMTKEERENQQLIEEQNQFDSAMNEMRFYGGGKTVFTIPAYHHMVSSKKKITTLLLCIFFGGLGFHKFYIEKVGVGILYMITGGLCGIGWIYDIIKIASGREMDRQGFPIQK